MDTINMTFIENCQDHFDKHQQYIDFCNCVFCYEILPLICLISITATYPDLPLFYSRLI